MKNIKMLLAALALCFISTAALADGYDWAYKSVSEFPTVTAVPASGDKKCFWVSAANKVSCYDATNEKLAGALIGTLNGSVGATTPSTGAFTSLTTTLGVTHTRTPAADSTTTNNGSMVALTAPIDTTGTNTHNAYDCALTISNATGGTNAVNCFKIENVTGDAQDNVTGINIGTGTTLGTSNAIQIGSGWDAGLVTDSAVQINSTNGTALTALRFASDTVASGQTAKTVTLTGVTASSKCVASPNEIPTNVGYIKSVAPGTDQVIVTVNTDPGASNLDLTVMCFN